MIATHIPKTMSTSTDSTELTYSQHLSNWKSHPQYHGSMAQHLIEDVHNYFRSSWERIMQQKKTKGKRMAFSRFMQSLHHHHQLEDDYFFPSIFRKNPKLKAPCKKLSKEHQEIIQLEKEILQQDEDDPLFQELLEKMDSLLIGHLNKEEIIVVPSLLNGVGSF